MCLILRQLYLWLEYVTVMDSFPPRLLGYLRVMISVTSDIVAIFLHATKSVCHGSSVTPGRKIKVFWRLRCSSIGPSDQD